MKGPECGLIESDSEAAPRIRKESNGGERVKRGHGDQNATGKEKVYVGAKGLAGAGP